MNELLVPSSFLLLKDPSPGSSTGGDKPAQLPQPTLDTRGRAWE